MMVFCNYELNIVIILFINMSWKQFFFEARWLLMEVEMRGLKVLEMIKFMKRMQKKYTQKNVIKKNIAHKQYAT